jgi:hypothetical protein
MRQLLARLTSTPRFIKVYVSSDNKVRAADVEYKLPGQSVFRTTTRPIHKLVLVIPVEEQGPAVDQAKGVRSGPSQVTPLAGGPPAPAHAEAIGTTAVAPPEVDAQTAHQAEPEVGEGKGLTQSPSPPERRRGGATRPQAQESDFQEEGGQADASHHRDGTEGGGRDSGHGGKTQEEREAKEES